MSQKHCSVCVQEFMREARIMVTLNHPCIVKLIGVTGGKPMMLVSKTINQTAQELNLERMIS